MGFVDFLFFAESARSTTFVDISDEIRKKSGIFVENKSKKDIER